MQFTSAQMMPGMEFIPLIVLAYLASVGAGVISVIFAIVRRPVAARTSAVLVLTLLTLLLCFFVVVNAPFQSGVRHLVRHWETNLLLAIIPSTPAVLGFIISYYRKGLKPGYCARCGYDLRGLPVASMCPECGKDNLIYKRSLNG